MIKYKVRRSIALLAMAFFMLPLTVDAQKISNNQRTTILSDLDENIRLLSKFQYDTPELITNYAAQLSDAEKAVARYADYKSDIMVYERWYMLKKLVEQNKEMIAFLQPKSADWLYRQGVAEMESGNGKRAMNFFEKALNANPKHVLSHFQIARLDIDSTKLGDAAKRLNEVLETMNPNSDEEALIKGILSYAYDKNYMYAINMENQEKYAQAVAVMLELEAFCMYDNLGICDSATVDNTLERCRTGVYSNQIELARKALKSKRNVAAEDFAMSAYEYYSANKDKIKDDMNFNTLAKQIAESYIQEASTFTGNKKATLLDEYLKRATMMASYTDKATKELLEAKVAALQPEKTRLELKQEAIENAAIDTSYSERFAQYISAEDEDLIDSDEEVRNIEETYVNEGTKVGQTKKTSISKVIDDKFVETKTYLSVNSFDKALEVLESANQLAKIEGDKDEVEKMYLLAIREITAKRMSAAEFAIWQGEPDVADSLINVTNDLIKTYKVEKDTAIVRIMKSYLMTLDKKVCSKRQEELNGYVYSIMDCLRRNDYYKADALVRTALAIPESKNCKLDKSRLKSLMEQIQHPLEYIDYMDNASKCLKRGDTNGYIQQYTTAEALYNRNELGTMGMTHTPMREVLLQVEDVDFALNALEVMIKYKEYMVALEALGAIKDMEYKAAQTKNIQDRLAKLMSFDMSKQGYSYDDAVETIHYYSTDKWYKYFTKAFKKYMKTWIKEKKM